MNRTIMWVAAAGLALGACNKKSENPPAGTPAGSAMMAGSGSAAMAAGSGSAAMAAGSGSAAGSASAGSAAGSGSAAPVAAVDVPTQMDFEDDATAKITDKNVEAEVKAIEKELDQK
jgi:hypothetical protein